MKIDLVKLVEEINDQECIEGGVHKIFALTCLHRLIEMQEEALTIPDVGSSLPSKEEIHAIAKNHALKYAYANDFEYDNYVKAIEDGANFLKKRLENK